MPGSETLTYYRQDGGFGALGHAVSDGDTGVQMSLSDGEQYLRDKNCQHPEGEDRRAGRTCGHHRLRGIATAWGALRRSSPLGIRGVLNDTAGELGGRSL